MAKRHELDDRERARQPKNTPSTSDPPLRGGLQLNLGHLLGMQTHFISQKCKAIQQRLLWQPTGPISYRFSLTGRATGVNILSDYVSMALEILDTSYSHTKESPVYIYVKGQGSCSLPSILLQICSFPFDCHNQCSNGANYSSPDRSIQFKTSMTRFVDDKKGQVNDIESPHLIPLQQLSDQMQSEAQLWGDLLHVSGGVLEIPKCNYYVMQ
jgi:hypothetical protein